MPLTLQHIDDATEIREGDSERAEGISTYYCSHCPNLHILLRDEDGQGFADMVMDVEIAEELLKFAKEAAAKGTH